jgi:predicted metalloprotease
MRQMQQGKSKAEANKLSVALELQAILCGGLTHYTKHERFLEDGDIEKLTALHMLLATMLFNQM